MSDFSVVRVTHRIVYPSRSKDVVAVAMALHVLPVPTLCARRMPLRSDSGVKYRRTKFCVLLKWMIEDLFEGSFTSSVGHKFSRFLPLLKGDHLYSCE